MIPIVCFPSAFFLNFCDQLIASSQNRVVLGLFYCRLLSRTSHWISIDAVEVNRWRWKIATDEARVDFNLHSSSYDCVFRSNGLLSFLPDTFFLQTPELKFQNFPRRNPPACKIHFRRWEKKKFQFAFNKEFLLLKKRISSCCVFEFLLFPFHCRSSHSVSSRPNLKHNIIDECSFIDPKVW